MKDFVFLADAFNGSFAIKIRMANGSDVFNRFAHLRKYNVTGCSYE